MRNVGGKQEVVEEPLPMPQGVSDLAIGGGAQGGVTGRSVGAAPAPNGGTLELGRTVEVTAGKRELVQRQSVSVERVITSADFKRLPVTSLSDDVGMQAGVSGSGTRGGGWTRTKGPNEPLGSVQIGKVKVNGDLSEQAVKDVVEKKLVDINWDYAIELSSQPKLKGRMVIEFVVQADGSVRDAKVTKNQLTADLKRKLINYFQKLTFPQPTGGEATVRVTLNFKP